MLFAITYTVIALTLLGVEVLKNILGKILLEVNMYLDQEFRILIKNPRMASTNLYVRK